MRSRMLPWLMCCGVVAAGCAGGPEQSAPARAASSATGAGALQTINDTWQRTWSGPANRGKTPPGWDWVTALPSAVSRAELVAPVLPAWAVAQLLPQLPEEEIRLVSGPVGPRDYRITAVNDMAVADGNQLHAAAARAVAAGKKITVALGDPVHEGKTGPNVSVEPAQMIALTQAVAPQERCLRVTEGGNPWVLLREDGVRGKLTARVERQHGLLHLALGLNVCWGPQRVLPREVRAACDGTALQCLSVAETLETLYGPRQKTGRFAAASASFAAASEREDYRMPTNYKRLQQAVEESAGPGAVPPCPAFISQPGIAYPGPVVLGDARALSAFLEQPQLLESGQPERVGWIIFSGESLRHGRTVHVDLDLGQGAHRLTFTVPES